MLDNNPLWYKDAIIHEVHVRAFHDSDGDGMGDFRGLTEKLDYLLDLGITAIWLLPFYPSPLKDDGYDIADYTSIHADYGTLDDFKEFLDAAHKRGIRVITELVINHTSDEHPWFQRARRARAGSSERNFYVWSDTADKYKGVRIIFQDFEHSNWTWDDVAGAYYWHRFYRHQPDLNYDNPDVWKAIFPVVDFWMDLGVDGMRLDAVPYIYEREGTTCENLPETHIFLRALREHVDKKYTNRMFLAEANQWPEDAVAYFGKGDECQMNFHFPLMPRLFMAIHVEDHFPILDIMEQTPPIPETCQWALFLRNHDELTLEMVTDEERDYMYRAYALDPRARINLGIRRRLAPLLGNNRRRIELMKGLLFSLPGTPILYYGDEIGMGDNIYLGDRNGVRTPMQWSGDRNAGFSRANPQKLYLPVNIDPEYHYEAINVETQQNNTSSLLWWMKRLIALRKHYRAFGRGSLQFLRPENHKILAFLRRYESENILVVANLSRFVQYVELELAEFERAIPIELFGRNQFPPIGQTPYLLTLGPHTFYWFALTAPSEVPSRPVEAATPEELLPTLNVERDWSELFCTPGDAQLEEVLPQFLQHRRWFGGKARTLKGVSLRDVVPLDHDSERTYLTLITTSFDSGDETYVVPLSLASGERATIIQREMPHTVLARVHGPQGESLLYDALADPRFGSAVLRAISRNRSFTTHSGATLNAVSFAHFVESRGPDGDDLPVSISKAEQSNTSILYGNRLIMKIFRRVSEGINPDEEVGRYLTDVTHFPHTPPVVGAVEFRRKRKAEPITLALLQGFMPNQGDAWQHTLDVLSSFYERALATRDDKGEQEQSPEVGTLLELAIVEATERAQEMIDTYLETARLLAKRTAEMHLALATSTDEPAFRPEPITALYQRSLYQSMRNLANQAFKLLRQHQNELPKPDRKLARRLLDIESQVFQRVSAMKDVKVSGLRTRIHGDYHLGQVLYTGKDFIIIDFEGEPTRSINERRLKRSPLRDVAGMVRSFHYAAYSALYGHGGRGMTPGVIRPEDIATLEPWARFWHTWVGAIFVKTYREVVADSGILPRSEDEFRLLLNMFLLEKAIYELAYELNHRPDWVKIPLLGLIELMDSPV
jgi:maltose alpha-D-glucosyltransferase/alpha-amylase